MPRAFAFEVAQDAKQELFAARYESAADLYSKRLNEAPEDADAYYGLVRALLRAHRSKEAFAVEEKAAKLPSQTPATWTARGLSAYRRGDIVTAEQDFRAALKLDGKYPGALAGLASIYSTASKYKTARDLRLIAYRLSPDDPELMLSYANSLHGADHIAELERVLGRLDPDSEPARSLKAHIGDDRAIGDRKLRKLTSLYEKTRVKMYKIMDGPNRLRGFGLHVQLNGKQTVRLLLDTGASGVSLSPKAAMKAGLETLGAVGFDAKGIGDDKAQSALSYIASELRTGDVEFSGFPISVFRSAQSSDYDGLIGADVFRQFIVGLDFPNLEMTLEPRPGGLPDAEEPVDAGNTPAPGFHRVLRFGDHLVVPTLMNEKKSGLFLVDSGSTSNLIDSAVAREASSVYGDSSTIVRGVQGKVDKVSRADRIVLMFAGFRQDNPDLLAIDMTKTGDSLGVGLAGILGMPVLGRLKVTIDYLDGALKLEYQR